MYCRRKLTATRLAQDESEQVDVVEGFTVRVEADEPQRSSSATPNAMRNSGFATSNAVNLQDSQFTEKIKKESRAVESALLAIGSLSKWREGSESEGT